MDIKEVVNLAAGDAVIFKIDMEDLERDRKHFRKVHEMLDEIGIPAIFMSKAVDITVLRKEDNDGQ